MSEHIDALVLGDYLNEALSPEDTANVNAHLEKCSECRNQAKEVQKIHDLGRSFMKGANSEKDKPSARELEQAAIKGLDSFLHIASDTNKEEFDVFVSGKMSPEDAEEWEEHLNECPQCSQAVEAAMELLRPPSDEDNVH